MTMQLRDYQQAAVDAAMDVLDRQGYAMFASPTGTGKSYCILDLLRRRPQLWAVIPRIEIIADMLKKLGRGVEKCSEADIVSQAELDRMITPIRLRNRLLAGGTPPAELAIDEAHHDLASSYQDLHALCGYCPRVGFTATPFRGTPRGTAEFRKLWGEPVWAITYPEAVHRGVLSFPTCDIWPLVDDDTCEMVNGEFVIASVEEETRPRLTAIAERCDTFIEGGVGGKYHWDRPTMFSLPTRNLAHAMRCALVEYGCPAEVITQETTQADRQRIFAATVRRECALVQVQVVSEGVDLPIRRLIDVSPSISPVKWLQQFGRITRPVKDGEAAPHYVGTNRNLLRHAYLLDGLLPTTKYKEVQDAFKPASTRAGIRVVGLEALGRLKPSTFLTKSGVRCTLYAVSTLENNMKVEYAALLHPLFESPEWCRKDSPTVDGERTYGKWSRCEPPADLKGFASLPGKMLSDAQRKFWNSCASRCGLLKDQELTRHNFAVLPILKDTGMRFQ